MLTENLGGPNEFSGHHKRPTTIGVMTAAVLPGLASMIAWLGVAPVTGDEHAARLRVWLARDQWTPIWNMRWLSGHHLPGYGIVLPVLARPFGLRSVAAICVVISCIAFGSALEVVLRRATGHLPQSRFLGACVALSVGLTANLWSGRLTFVAGVGFVSIVVVVVVCSRRGGRRWLGLPVVVLGAVVATLTSPLAGLFLAMTSGSLLIWAATDRLATKWIVPGGATAHFVRVRRADFVVALLVPLATIGVMAVAFPEGGSLPFATSALVGVVCAALGLAVLGRHHPALVVASAVTVASALVLYVVDTPIGANVGRLAVLMAPAALLLMAPRRARGWHRIVFGAALCIAIGWQWSWPISDVTKAAGDRTNHQRFFAPMIDAIRADANVSGTSAPRGGRVEVVPLRSKADADWVAREFPLARGWDRQVDRRDNANLYRQLVTSADYRSWLDDHAVTYVAVPSGALDEGGRGETALLASPPDYLVEMFTSADWRVFRVTNAVPIVASVDGVAADAVDGAVSVGVDSLTFVATQPNSQVSVRINDSRWLHVDRSTSGDACVATHADHMVTLRIRRPGQITLRVSLATSTNC